MLFAFAFSGERLPTSHPLRCLEECLVCATDTFSWVPLSKRSQYQEIQGALGKIESVQHLMVQKAAALLEPAAMSSSPDLQL
jgi:hypothetical protein